ncbi:PITH domain-containing protein [Ditylenchus destructor]|nr:PITH domain-containing protein [Ditylenchus destructor]
MCSHGNPGGHGGSCADSVAQFDHGSEGMQYNLDNCIVKEKVVVLNEAVEGSGVKVFKSWEDKHDRTQFVESDVDQELLFYIPFKGHVKVSGIAICGNLDDSHPANVRIFKDKDNMSFDEVSTMKPIQEMQLKQDDAAQIDYPLIATKFASVSSLTLYINANFGADSTRIFYIGLRGEYERDFRDKVVIATYEARPVPDDHKAELPDTAHHHVC